MALEKLDFAGASASRGLAPTFTGATRLERELATENVPGRYNDVLAELRQLDLNVAGAPVRFGRTLVQVKTETGNMALKRAVTESSQLQDRLPAGTGFLLLNFWPSLASRTVTVDVNSNFGGVLLVVRVVLFEGRWIVRLAM